jgi:hypothetical protein
MRKSWGLRYCFGLERRGSEAGSIGGGDFSMPRGRVYLEVCGVGFLRLFGCGGA